MTDQQIDVAIAEACGRSPGDRCFYHQCGEDETIHREDCPCLGTGWIGIDYTTDLNAMHEAEKTLTEFDLQGRYPRELASLVVSCGWLPESATSILRLCHATARQRAEAFLRTIGRWQESPVEPARK